jgi:hypothetical protein
MEQKYKSLSLFEFPEQFGTDNQCLNYLSKLKWKLVINVPNAATLNM